MCVGICTCVQVLEARGVASLGTGVQVVVSCPMWKLNSSPLKEENVLLPAEPSIQPRVM